VSDEAPSTRHGDVLLAVWIIVGGTMCFVLTFTDMMHLPRLALALMGALAAGYGEAVSRALRPNVRFRETAVAVIIAFVLVPQAGRFGGKPFDHQALLTMIVGTPLGLAAAWLMRRWKATAGNAPEVVAGVFLAAAAVGLGVVLLVALNPKSHFDHLLEVAFLVTSIAAGASFAAVAPRAHPGHLILGAMIVLVAPRLMTIGILRYVPVSDVMKWTGAIGVGGTLGVLVGRKLRARALERARPATNLPEARVVDEEPG
jgi:hypothetical protein